VRIVLNALTQAVLIDPYSAGLAGAFIDREVETKGVRSSHKLSSVNLFIVFH